MCCRWVCDNNILTVMAEVTLIAIKVMLAVIAVMALRTPITVMDII